MVGGYRPAPSVRLRGRDSEQRAIAVALGDARSGCGAALLVSGGPGLGKSALLEHAAVTASDFTVLRTGGVRPESRLAHAGLQRLLRPVAHRAAELPAAQAAVLGRMLESGDVAESERFALSIAALGLLSLVGRTSPLLCCVDDAHLMDPASLDVLLFAALRLDADPIAMVFAARDEQGKATLPGVPVLNLAPLNDNAVHDVLADAAPGTLEVRVRADLAAAARGNPLAARGLVAALTADQLAGARPLPEPLPLDGALRRALVSRLDGLPSITRRLLLLAAVDPEAQADDLVSAADRPGLSVGVFEPAEDAGVVRIDGDRLRFRDSLMREAIRQDASAVRRRAAHAMLARVLDPSREPSRYAGHRSAAAQGPDPALASELAAAADTARELEGHAAASAVLERAAELTPAADARLCRLSSAAHDAWLAGRPQRASALLGRARPLAATGRPAGVVELLRGSIELRDGNAIDAAESLMAAAERLIPHDRGLAVRALLRAADAASLAGDPVRHAAAARRLAPLARDDDPPALRLGFAFLEGCTTSFSGDYAAAAGPLRRVLELADEVDEPAELVWAAIAGLRLGDTSRVHSLATRALRAARHRGALAAVPPALEFLVYAEFWTGRFPSAAGNCLTGLRVARETGQPNCATHHLAALSLLAAIQGDADTCRARARAVAERASENSLGLPTALSTWALAVLELAHGDAAGAFFRLRALVNAGPGHGHPTMRLLTAPYFVEAAVRTGETARAESALAGYERWAAATGSVGALALAARCRGLLARTERAAEHFEEALRLYRASGGDDVERARTQLLYGAALRRNRLPGRAREHLRDALETFERFGARLWVNQARAELRAIGDSERRPESPIAGELTVQQHQIALLVAEGATNREVAAHMFISPRTVEHHLRGIFRKLNIRSRVDLARLFP
ncbi:DNA-binding NarL/FixJ family response regulator [Spinactinospora alkalitolerans]|uniref:DNA-binding NarL/FixJ family response regulator n=1 Tax=Spinactinospora alkalitolerans TaxID=687207 RepID=A0A852TZ68_9ACTN|nr:LuxR family transcriptional regulator [Spinactinospora alkalitolerans]NYE47264.1 DNA-binding NarL/FixJ family response regulator [Spinactinospora alkalitolerans]